MILSYGAKPVPVKNVLLLLFALALALTAGRGLWLVISTEDAAAEFSYDYALSAINAGPAYAEGYWGESVTVAVAGTGVDPEHAELVGQVVPGYDFITQTPEGAFIDSRGHETLMGGLIAGRVNSRWGHGVAPRAKLMPLKINVGVHTISYNSPAMFFSAPFYDFLHENKIQIINNTYGRRNRIHAWFNDEKVLLDFPPGYYRPDVYGIYNSNAKKLAAVLAQRDLISVWGTGNDGWNTQHKLEFWNEAYPGQTFSIARQTFISLAVIESAHIVPPGMASVAMRNIPNVEKAMPYFQALYPFFALPSVELFEIGLGGEEILAEEYDDYNVLQERWLVVAAIDAQNKIAEFSNGCGPAKNWCVAAPGKLVKVVVKPGNAVVKISGTSGSAALVSGALAVLQSGFPEMKMIDLKNILLKSATKPGPGPWPNEIYGHGIVNLGAALELAAQERGKQKELFAAVAR